MTTPHIKKHKIRSGLTEDNFRRFEHHLLRASTFKEATFDPAPLKANTWITYARDARKAWLEGLFTSSILPLDAALGGVKFFELEDGRVLSENRFFGAYAKQLLTPKGCSVEIKNGVVLSVNQKEPITDTDMRQWGCDAVRPLFEGLSSGSLNGFRVLYLIQAKGLAKPALYKLGDEYPSVEIEECAEEYFRLR